MLDPFTIESHENAFSLMLNVMSIDKCKIKEH